MSSTLEMDFREAVLKDVSDHVNKILEDHHQREEEYREKYIAKLEEVYLAQYKKMLEAAPKVPTLFEHAAISALNGLLANDKLQGRPSEFAKDAVVISKFLLAELKNADA